MVQKNKYIWTNETATTLGIVFANNRMKYHELNMEPKIKEFCNCLKRWKRHSLSLIGKITVIKTFALPKIIYPLTVLENPPIEYINLIKKSMIDFIWDSKPPKIKLKTIIQDYTKGGLKMIEIESFIKAIKAGWVKRLSDTDNIGDWKNFYLTELHNYGGVSFFKCNINSNDTKQLKFKSKFLTEIVTSWADINFNNEVECYLKQFLWNNSNIKHNNKTLYYHEWHELGIDQIEKIFDKRLNNFFYIPTFKKYVQIKKLRVFKILYTY